MILRFLHHFLLFHLFLFHSWYAIAVSVNRTIDDTAGDPFTGTRPLYLPTTPGIWEDATCAGCRVKADRSLAFKGSWTSATFRPEVGPISIELNFTGTAIYVFFILANFVAPGITTETACNFTLDGQFAGSFQHTPSTSTEFQYNASVFTGENLANINHNLVISSSGLDRHVFMSFDYAIYTVDEPSTSSAPSTSSVPTGTTTAVPVPKAKVAVGAIAGGVAGGVTVLLAFFVALFFFCRRRRKRAVFVASEKRPMAAPPSESSAGYRSNDSSVPFTIDGVPYYERSASGTRDRRAQPPRTSAFSGEIVLNPQPARPREDPSRPPRAYTHSLTSSSGLDPEAREELRRARQAEIDRQLRQLVREMRDLNKDRKLDATASGNTGGHHHSSSQTRREEVEIAVMREQMQAMQEQIDYLQGQQSSEWAQGLSDEPPPGYSVRVPSIRLPSRNS
ncbi:hypothetical protein FPV67DRAFT_1462396 [Lyophyllum atratum]|nr:hypothetical protein FPV67DRAFT_1462396 [Lyophyllum atratum]